MIVKHGLLRGMQAKGISKQDPGPKIGDNGEWRRLRSEELHSFYHSPNIVRVIKPRRLKWIGHVTRVRG